MYQFPLTIPTILAHCELKRFNQHSIYDLYDLLVTKKESFEMSPSKRRIDADMVHQIKKCTKNPYSIRMMLKYNL